MYQILQTLQIYLSNIFIICFKNCTEYFNLINQAPTYKISNTSDVIFITQQRDIATVHKIIHSWRGNFPPELIHLIITAKVRILYLAIPKIPFTKLISFTHQIIFNFLLHFQSILHGIQSALKAPG